jgi:hypothetical protein
VYYGRVNASVATGREVVKFMTDAALLVFPNDAVESRVNTFFSFRRETDSWLGSRAYPARFIVKAHWG